MGLISYIHLRAIRKIDRNGTRKQPHFHIIAMKLVSFESFRNAEDY